MGSQWKKAFPFLALLVLLFGCVLSLSTQTQYHYGALEANNTWLGTNAFNMPITVTGASEVDFTQAESAPNCASGAAYRVWPDSGISALVACNAAGSGYKIVLADGDINTSDQVTSAHISGATLNDLVKFSSTGNRVNAVASDVIALWGGGSCSGFLNSSGGCATVGAGGLTTYSATGVTVSATTYFPAGGGGAPSTTAANVESEIGMAATLSNFCVTLSAAPGSGNSLTFAWMDGASAQTLTVTISNNAVVACDGTHSFTTAVNDQLSVRSTPSGSVSITPNVQMTYQVGSLSVGAINPGSQYQLLYLATAGAAASGLSTGTIGWPLLSGGASNAPAFTRSTICSVVSTTDQLTSSSSFPAAFQTTCSVPTGKFASGTLLEIYVYGNYITTSTSSPKFALQINAGGSTGICPATNAALTLPLNQNPTAEIWTATCFIQIGTTGSSGAANAWGDMKVYQFGGTFVSQTPQAFSNATTVAYNTTTNETVSVFEESTFVAGQTANLAGMIVRASW